jgi:hypothetical protein
MTPYLVQRIMRSNVEHDPDAVRQFSLGGDLTNKACFFMEFDYMGSAEFEYGVVPKVLKKVRDEPDNTTFSLTLKGKPKVLWESQVDKNLVKSVEKTVFCVCKSSDKDSLIEWINLAASGKEARLKEISYFQSGLFGDVKTTNRYPSGRIRNKPKSSHEDSPYCGWLDVDNGWFVTTDESMFNNFKKLVNLENFPLPSLTDSKSIQLWF